MCVKEVLLIFFAVIYVKLNNNIYFENLRVEDKKFLASLKVIIYYELVIIYKK